MARNSRISKKKERLRMEKMILGMNDQLQNVLNDHNLKIESEFLTMKNIRKDNQVKTENQLNKEDLKTKAKQFTAKPCIQKENSDIKNKQFINKSYVQKDKGCLILTDAIEILSKFNLLSEAILEKSEYIANTINSLQDEQQDLLHDIELSPFSAVEGYKLSKNLKEVRSKRRDYKNIQELLSPLLMYLKYHKKEKNDFENIEQEMKEIQKKQKTRMYRPRVRKDLKIQVMQDKQQKVI